MGDKVIEIYG